MKGKLPLILLLHLAAAATTVRADALADARSAMAAFQYDAAITNLTSLPAETRPADVWRLLAMALTQKSQQAADRLDAAAERSGLEAAQAAVAEALRYFPDDPELLARRGGLASRLAQGQGAAASLAGLNRLLLDSEQALRLCPTNPVACTVAGATQYTLADMPWWQRSFVLPNLATEWGRKPTFARAVDLLARAVKSAPEIIHLRVWYGKALAAAGQPDAAREQWRQALAIKPLLATDARDQIEARQLLARSTR